MASPSSLTFTAVSRHKLRAHQSLLPFAYKCLFRELLSYVLMSSEVAEWKQTFSGRLLTRCMLFADNDPKLSCKLQLQSYLSAAPYHLGRRRAPVASSRSRGILSRKERCPKCELRREDSPDRSEVPADFVKFVKRTRCRSSPTKL